MKLAVVKERRKWEHRVAATPDSVKKLAALGFSVSVEAGAGEAAGYADAEYKASGAEISDSAEALLKSADIVAKVQRPLFRSKNSHDEITPMKEGAILVGMLAPLENRDSLEKYAGKKITAFALELIPRITRAQGMDVLSSQANLAGYRAVIEASAEFGRGIPMMMTAAGTIPPAKALVLGAGVAGLQAIATARRLGAVVSAFDVRAAAKEQVMSLGAKFVEVAAAEDAETKGGYAKEMDEEYKKRQAEAIADNIRKSDMVISTALIPGKPAPRLITAEMVKSMRAGSVIVDLAVASGGNCELSEMGKTVTTENGVKIIGHPNLPSRIAADASRLYAQNVLNFLALLVDKESKTIKINQEDEIIKSSLVAMDGKVMK